MAINNILGSAGFVIRGIYSATETYNYLNVVTFNTHTFVCQVRGGITNMPPPSTATSNTQWFLLLEASAGATDLNDLTDVTLANEANGDVLVYNSTTSVFENQQPTGDEVTVTGPDAITGEVIITEDGTAHPFDSGHALYTKDGSTPNVGIPGIIAQRKNLVFNGPNVSNETILINGVSTQVTEVSTTTLLTSTDTTANSVTPFNSRTDNREVVEIFKKSVGTPDEIIITDNGAVSTGLLTYSAPQIVTNKIGVDSLTGDNGTIRSIKDVSLILPGDGDVLVYNSINNQYEPEHHGDEGTLESLSDVNTSNEVDGDFLQLFKRTATYYIEPRHVTDGAIFSVKCPGGELITSPAGFPPIRQIDFVINHNQSVGNRVITLTNGNAHVQVAINFTFAPSVDNVITTLFNIFNLSAFSSVFSWGGSLGDRNRNINSHGNYSLVGSYSTILNPNPASATTATGSLGFRDARFSTEQPFDVGSIKLSIDTGISTASATINLASTMSFTTFNSQILTAINSQAAIADHFTVTNPINGTFVFTAKATGASSNGKVEIEFFDTGGRGNHSDDIAPAFGTAAFITGGAGAGSTSVFQWTDGTQRTLKNLSFINCISSFINGGNTWRNAIAPGVTGLAGTSARIEELRGNGWVPGSRFVITEAGVEIRILEAVAAQVTITFPETPTEFDFKVVGGMMSQSITNFFQQDLASTPSAFPDRFFIGNFTNRTNTIVDQNQADGGATNEMRVRVDTTISAQERAAAAATALNAFDGATRLDDSGTITQGAAYSLNCTVTANDSDLIITSNFAGAVATLSELQTAGTTGLTLRQGVNAQTIGLTRFNEYIVLTPTTMLNLTNLTSFTVI